MKIISFFLLTLVILSYCGNNNRIVVKGISPIIVKEGVFIDIQISVTSKQNELFTDITYTNKSTERVLFYDALLPIGNKLRENIFSIFESESLEQIPYTGPKKEKYLKMAPDDEQGVIIPDLARDRFKVLMPNEPLSFRINLFDFYDFQNIKDSSVCMLTPNSYLPAISSDYKQLLEKDSVSNEYRPVYYSISLPRKQSVDSMRIPFKIIK